MKNKAILIDITRKRTRTFDQRKMKLFKIHKHSFFLFIQYTYYIVSSNFYLNF